jgi:hypothetical protein
MHTQQFAELSGLKADIGSQRHYTLYFEPHYKLTMMLPPVKNIQVSGPTLLAVVKNRTGNGVVNDHHAITAVTEVASWTQLARLLAHLVLLKAGRVEHGGGDAAWAVVTWLT